MIRGVSRQPAKSSIAIYLAILKMIVRLHVGQQVVRAGEVEATHVALEGEQANDVLAVGIQHVQRLRVSGKKL
jgi:hypothetical protein